MGSSWCGLPGSCCAIVCCSRWRRHLGGLWFYGIVKIMFYCMYSFTLGMVYSGVLSAVWCWWCDLFVVGCAVHVVCWFFLVISFVLVS